MVQVILMNIGMTNVMIYQKHEIIKRRTMIIFQIIMSIFLMIGMCAFAAELDKDKEFNNFHNAICVGAIAICGIFLGMFIASIFIYL